MLAGYPLVTLLLELYCLIDFFSDSDCHFCVFIGWRRDVNIWRGDS